MPDAQACYRELRNYKYQLMQDYTLRIGIKKAIDHPFMALTEAGDLTVRNRYAWDGPSGPSIDTRTFMRGSLIHDVLYQLMRERLLDHTVHREYADDLLRDMCIEDGMSRFRAWYVHGIVRRFGKKNAMPGERAPDPITCVP